MVGLEMYLFYFGMLSSNALYLILIRMDFVVGSPDISIHSQFPGELDYYLFKTFTVNI